MARVGPGRSRRRRLASGLAPKLALFSALLVSIPVGAWLYFSREVPQFALEAQGEALDLAARAVSTVLHDRPKLFRVEGVAPARLDDCPPLELTGRMRRDGSARDWNDLAARSCRLETLRGDAAPGDAPFAVDLSLGRTRRHLWALFRVEDADFHIRHPRYSSLDRSDHVEIALPGEGGAIDHYVVLLEADGATTAYAVGSQRRYPLGDGQPAEFIEGRWLATQGPGGETSGYVLELSLRLEAFPGRIGFAVADVDRSAGWVARLVGTVDTEPGGPGDAPRGETAAGTAGLVFLPAPELEAILDGLQLERARIQVIDVRGHVRTAFDAGIGRVPALERSRLVAEARAALPGSDWAVTPYVGEAMSAAAAPIWLGGEVGGVVLIEQSNLQTLAAREAQLSEFFLAILGACLFAGALLSLFAARLGWRIRRLRNEAAGAIDAVGRVQTLEIAAAARARDEVGDLSRTLSELLGRLGAYTRFREEIPRVLRHEINNPLNTLSLSLQNLGSEDPELKNNPYVQSAERGVRRIHEIIETVTEAANLEQTLGEETLEPMDLAALVRDYCASPVLGASRRRFRVTGADTPAWVRGSEFHVERLLDKLIDNAVEFSAPGSEIEVALARTSGHGIQLTVSNAGPTLSEDQLEQIFDALFSNHPPEPAQKGTSASHTRAPHLGIGLYLVRLIATSMGGRSFARNRKARDGVDGAAGVDGVEAGVEVGVEVPGVTGSDVPGGE
ncbi:MAG: ATP-binding protein [Myxococcota bacterium]|nr:ATP-binding protein [Myxococcota bacterium]